MDMHHWNSTFYPWKWRISSRQQLSISTHGSIWVSFRPSSDYCGLISMGLPGYRIKKFVLQCIQQNKSLHIHERELESVVKNTQYLDLFFCHYVCHCEIYVFFYCFGSYGIFSHKRTAKSKAVVSRGRRHKMAG